MKFLSDEWFDELFSRVRKEFSKPGKLSLTYCETYTGCPDGVDKWAMFKLENGVMTEMTHGTGPAPATEYCGFGDYANHVKICKGELNPKKAVMAGTLTIQDNVKAGAMRTVQLIGMYNKIVECKMIPGTEY